MNVLNIHSRNLNCSKSVLWEIVSTLATREDKIWPLEKWPPIRFKNGIKEGAEGGHGPIRYKVLQYEPGSKVVFEFQRPLGFKGLHYFELHELTAGQTEFRHTVSMQTTGTGTLIWLFAIRWLHDALLEDALDKVENQLMNTSKRTEWNFWVRFLWYCLK